MQATRSSLRLRVQSESWPISGQFRISRETYTQSNVVVAEIRVGEFHGRGECEPEDGAASIGAVMKAICGLEAELMAGMTREKVRELLPSGPARNAIDCALWDLEAKRSGRRAWELIDLPMQQSVETAYTLGIDTPQSMAQSAAAHADFRLIKIKLGGKDDIDLERVRAVRRARPDARFIIDANGGWDMQRLSEMAGALVDLGVELIEQPLARGADDALLDYRSPVPLCADESCVDRKSLPHVVGRYQYVNIKLDKTGGLTEALALAQAAKAAGLGIMVGCMVGTSLAMAPATLVAQFAKFVDLDGPMLLAADRDPAMTYRGGRLSQPPRELWG